MMESRLHACRGASFSLLLDPDVGDRGREELLGATQPKTCNVSPASAQHRGLGTHFWGRGSSIRIGTFGRWPLREGCRLAAAIRGAGARQSWTERADAEQEGQALRSRNETAGGWTGRCPSWVE